MTTQYTPILKLALPVTGELSGTWGDTVNDNITSMVEQAVAGLATISTWSGNSKTLTVANGTTSESRCAMLVAQTGSGGSALTGAGEIVCPASSKLYVLKNDSSFAITLKTAAGTGVAVAAGNTAFLFCDGTNVNACVTTIIDGRVTGNLTVDGNATINGNTTLGNATSDTITATARFASDLVPSTDNARDLGSSGNSWKDVYIDGTAYLALVDINGGTIDGVSIGASTAATIINVDNLRLDGNTLSSTDTNGNVVIAPNGTGDVQLDADTVRVGDSGAAATLTSNGAGALTVTTGGAANLVLSTNSGTDSGTITINNGANANIVLAPNGTGDVQLDADTVRVGDSNTDVTLTSNGTGNLNLSTNGGTNSGTIQIAQGANASISLTPNGTGTTVIKNPSINGTTTFNDGTANAVIYLNGSKQATTSANLTFDGTTLTAAGFADSSLTSGRVTYATTSGNLTDSANLLYSGTDLTVYGITVGRGAGAVSTNTAVGNSALAANTTGSNNTAIGASALNVNETASFNTAIGVNALASNTTGDRAVAVGDGALSSNTTGQRNVALGRSSLAANTTGNYNIGVGGLALGLNTTGAYNIAMGYQALYSNTTASNNTAVGYQAGYSNTTGRNNTAFGYQAGYSMNQTDSSEAGNQLFGFWAGQGITSGKYNAFLGYNAGYLVTTGSKNTVIGSYNGNQNGLDIRTANNYIVLSDGDGNPRIVVDGGGFGGIGVNPANQYAASGGASWQVGRSTNIWNYSVSGNDQTRIYNNAYIDTAAADRYLNTNRASLLQMADGRFFVRSAPSGSAGALATFTTILDLSLNETLALQGATSQSGTGITFPATQNASSNANTLDDYEQGTFTPTVGGTWLVNPSLLSGTYVKIGRQVYVRIIFQGAASKSTSTTGWIDSLPFTVVVEGTGSGSDSGVLDTGNVLFANSTRMWLTANSFAVGANYFSGTYLAAD